MRIQRYESKGSVSAPQIRATQIAAPVDLGKAISFVENRYEEGLRDQEKAQKLFYANEKSRVDLAIDVEFAKSQEAIANGDFGAEQRFQKFYDKTVKDSMARMSTLPSEFSHGAMQDYERSGVVGGLKLKSAVRSKMKAETASNLGLKLSNLQIEMSNAEPGQEAEIIKKANNAIAALVANGSLDKAQEQLAVRQFLSESVDVAIENDPGRFREDYANNPDKYKGIASIKTKLKYATRLEVEKKAQDDALSVLGELSADKEKFAAYRKTGSVPFSEFIKDKSETGIAIAESLERRSAGVKPTDLQVVSVRNAMDANYKKLVKEHFKDGDFVFSKKGMEDVRNFNLTVYSTAPDLTKKQIDLMLAPADGLAIAVSEHNKAGGGIISWLPGISNPYGRALDKISDHVSGTLGVSKDIVRADSFKRDYIESFAVLYESAIAEAKEAGKPGVILRDGKTGPGNEIPIVSSAAIDYLVGKAISGTAIEPPKVNLGRKVMKDPVSGVSAYVYDDGTIEVIE